MLLTVLFKTKGNSSSIINSFFSKIKDLCISNNYQKHFIVGWNNWNHYHFDVDDKAVRESVDMMVSSGIAAAGYNYGQFYFT